MAEYPGAAWAGVSPNKAPREGKVELFIVHHWAGGYGGDRARAAIAQRDVFMRSNARRVSPNFQVNADGSVWEIVPPDRYRAWTTGLIDHKAVTCETQNVSGAPAWGISHESHEAIAHLVAWAAQRYGFPIQRGRVAKGNRVVVPGVIGHNEAPTAATACPGPSMNLDWIVDRARQIASGGAPASTGTPIPTTEGFLMGLNDQQQQQLLDATIAIKAALLDGRPETGGGERPIDTIFHGIRDVQERMYPKDADGNRFGWDAFDELTKGMRALVARAGGEVDEAEVAEILLAGLAPIIAANPAAISDDTLDELVRRLLDEQAKRLAS